MACTSSLSLDEFFCGFQLHCFKQPLQSTKLNILKICRVVVNGKLFAIGGKGTSGTVLDSIEVYQPSSNSWSSFAKLPSGRSSLGCAASNNNIIIAGGNFFCLNLVQQKSLSTFIVFCAPIFDRHRSCKHPCKHPTLLWSQWIALQSSWIFCVLCQFWWCSCLDFTNEN